MNTEKEVWKYVKGYEQLYAISNLGRFKNIRKNYITDFSEKPNNRYSCVFHKNGKKENLRAHQVVAMMFCEKPDGADLVRFKNEDRRDIRASNLYWGNQLGLKHYKPKKKLNAKLCTKCGCGYSIIPYFTVRKNGHINTFCKECEKIWRRDRLKKRSTEVNAKRKLLYDNRTEEQKIKFRKQRLDYQHRKLLKSTEYKLRRNVGNLIYVQLKNFLTTKKDSTVKYLGCPISFYKVYLEKQFDNKMSWQNHGSYWQIDHIVPLSKFNLADPKDQLISFHFNNTRPLEKIANLKKSNKLTEPQIKLPL